MAKTETSVSNLKINRGTYAKIQENLASINENELIITTDKNVPIPTASDNGKVVLIDNGDFALGDLDADAIDDTNTTNKFVTNAMYDYLDDLLYQKPAIDIFQLMYYNGSVWQTVSSTQETGSTITVNGIQHLETNISNIDGTLTFDSQSITKTNSTTNVSLTSPLSISTSTTKTLSGTNNKGTTFSKSYTINFYTYVYYKVTSSKTTPTSSLTKSVIANATTGEINVSYSASDYIYFYHTSANKTIQQYSLGQWNNVTQTEDLGQVTITKANGTTATYYAYRVGPFMSGGTDTFRIA